LKEQMCSILHENGILKRAVAIQHERLKEYGDKVKELDGLKQTLSQYQEKIRTLEVDILIQNMHILLITNKLSCESWLNYIPIPFITEFNRT
jgi:hypothetical protein